MGEFPLNAGQLMRSDFVQMDKDSAVSSLIGKLKSKGQTSAVICNESGTYVGLASRKNLLKPKLDVQKVKVSSVMESAPTLDEDEALERIAELMYTSESRMLAVTRNHKPVGVVRAMDVVNELLKNKRLRNLRVNEIATKEPVTILEHGTLGDAVQIMRDRHVGRIPVVNQRKELVGIVSFRDIMENYLIFPVPKKRGRGSKIGFDPKELSVMKSPIQNIFSQNVVSVSQNDSLEKVIRLMNENHLADVIVLDGKKLAGIITARDLLEGFLRLKQEDRNIQLSGMPSLDEIDSAKVQKTVEGTYDKLRKMVPKISYLAVHVKTAHQQGGKTQFQVNARVAAPAMLVVSNATEWNLITGIQECMAALEKETIKKARDRRWWMPF